MGDGDGRRGCADGMVVMRVCDEGFLIAVRVWRWEVYGMEEKAKKDEEKMGVWWSDLGRSIGAWNSMVSILGKLHTVQTFNKPPPSHT